MRSSSKLTAVDSARFRFFSGATVLAPLPRLVAGGGFSHSPASGCSGVAAGANFDSSSSVPGEESVLRVGVLTCWPHRDIRLVIYEK